MRYERNHAITTLPSRDLVLIGAGHTNLHVVRTWRMQPIPDVRLTLVSPFSRATYSGMLPGTLAGLYQPDDMEIDLHRFAMSCGVRLIVESAVGLDPTARRVLLRDRPALRYDVAAIGIGSVPGQRSLWEGQPHVLSIKPMATFLPRLKSAVETLTRVDRGLRNAESATTQPSAPSTQPLAVTVVGAGAGGTEITFCIDSWLRRNGIAAAVTLIDAHENILAGYSAGTRNRGMMEFSRRGITVRLNQRVERIDEREITLRDGTSLPSDLVIWAASAAAPAVLENFPLPKSPDGFLAVRPTLQTTADFPVFAVGDTASLVSNPVPKAGVYAVREGPILWENLQLIFAGRDLTSYQPQRGFLSLLNTGDGSALLDYRGYSAQGRWAWKLKDYIDRKFMRMYQDYEPRMEEGSEVGGQQSVDGGRWTVDGGRRPPGSAAMRCAGCGGKVGSNVLAAALERLKKSNSPEHSVLGTEYSVLSTQPPPLQAEDATVINPQTTPVELLSVDFFPAFLDDPYLIGRIAALHALSDIWAMGGEPQGVLAMVTIPGGEPRQQSELLFQLLAGGKRELEAHGVELWGGHTTEGPELNIGFTVTGRLNGRAPLAKGGLRPGDRLVLTKPMGTGTLLVAYRLSAARATWVDAMLAQMLVANAAASRAARDHGATAVTDVTGFGLAGHLLEMLDAGGVSACLSLSSLPLLDGFAELAASTLHRSSLDPANRANEMRLRTTDAAPLSPALSPGGRGKTSDLAIHPGYHALFDPQTAGGLLIAVPADRADALVAQLKNDGCGTATVVGEVFEKIDDPSLSISV
ncbi:MAG: selenide, water dikinase SelD [Planctomycetales bacterium]|nr:selenide, water dikinase SelD [Planctomycetales bacterium]